MSESRPRAQTRLLSCVAALAAATALHALPEPPRTTPTNCATAATATAAVATAVATGADDGVVPSGHAHNDYLHPAPLTDALAAGFSSVEVDVWPVDGELLVGHSLAETTPERTLETLYLAPLRAMRQRGQLGDQSRGGPGDVAEVQLLIDVKGDQTATLPLLDRQLAEYGDILTRYRGCATILGPVSVVLSGNATPQPPTTDRVRRYGYDVALGRFDDTTLTAAVAPLVSAEWQTFFTWNGYGPMPPEQRSRLVELVDLVHDAGSAFRLYGAPEHHAPYAHPMWDALTAVGVDYVNTDDLAGYAAYSNHSNHSNHSSHTGGTGRTLSQP